LKGTNNMEPTLVFTKQAISSKSDTSGENIDFFSAPASSMAHIGASFGAIIIFFKDSNLFSDNSIAGGASTKKSDFAKVTLKVRSGREVDTIELLQSALKQEGKLIRFDNTTRVYDVRGITEVISIERTELPTDDDIYLSCGASGIIDDIEPGEIDTTVDSFMFYDDDDGGVSKVESVPDFLVKIAGTNITASDGQLNAVFDLPGGTKYSVLNKVSDDDNDYAWTETPQFEELKIAKWSTSDNPKLLFTRSRNEDHTYDTTTPTDILAEIGFNGVSSNREESQAGKITVTQSKSSTASPYVGSTIDFFVGTQSGDSKAFTINDERVIAIQNQDSPPTAIRGGIYANNNDILFFGIN
jgi:hypothetical protein